MQRLHTDAISYAEVPGWAEDDHLAAFGAFCVSGRRLQALAEAGDGYLGKPTPPELLAVISHALDAAPQIQNREQARTFFETHFAPCRFAANEAPGLLTGYYEPCLDASRSESANFPVPLHARPANLINLMSDADRGQAPDRQTHALVSADGTQTQCPTRQQIESGQSAFAPTVIAWLSCPVDAFFLHVEGSGQLRFEDGTRQRVTYDGKNGHPYTSIGQALIADGVFEKGTLTFDILKAWLKADLERARTVMWRNKSYIFFRSLRESEPDTALGVLQIPLKAGRSLAVDTAYHAIGMPVFVAAPDLTAEPDTAAGFHHLMIAHDVGSAIRGPQRGDIFYGSGPEAGAHAGRTVHAGTFTMLTPRTRVAS